MSLDPSHLPEGNDETCKHLFGRAVNWTLGHDLDNSRVGAIAGVGGSFRNVSGAGPDAIFHRQRIRGDEKRSRAGLPSLPL